MYIGASEGGVLVSDASDAIVRDITLCHINNSLARRNFILERSYLSVDIEPTFHR